MIGEVTEFPVHGDQGAKVDFVSDRELNLFKAILFPSPSLDPSESQNTPQNTPQNAPQKMGLSQRILEVIREDAYITVQGAADKLGISRETVKEYVAKLKAKGELKRIGSDRSGHWAVMGEG